MKKFYKGINLFAAVVMLFSLTISGSAATVNDDIELREPIRVIDYIDENGNHVVEKTYFTPDPGSSGITFSDEGDISVCADTNGRGWYEKEKLIANATSTYIHVKAYFVWGDGDVSVSNATGWIEGVASGTTTSNESVKTGTGRFAGLFNKYAYAEYYVITTNLFGVSQGNTVRVTVSQSGNVS